MPLTPVMVERQITDACRLPLLAEYRALLGAKQRRVSLILVTHVLPTSVEYVRALAEDFDIEVVLAISYSFDNDAGNLLDPLPVVRCVDTADLERKLSDAVLRCSNSGRPFIVQEIGGYFAQTLAELGSVPGLVGVVEDTRQGHWRYQKVNERLPIPVLSIAESPLKALEHHQIGRAIVYSVERQVRSHFFRSLAGEQVAIVGFGDIGSAAAHAMRGRNAVVSVYDVDPHKRASAWMQNFKVSTLEEIARTANIIIGCAGSQSIGADVLDNLQDGPELPKLA